MVSVYKKSLGDDISSETSGDFRKALLTLADVRFIFYFVIPQLAACSLIIIKGFKSNQWRQ